MSQRENAHLHSVEPGPVVGGEIIKPAGDGTHLHCVSLCQVGEGR